MIFINFDDEEVKTYVDVRNEEPIDKIKNFRSICEMWNDEIDYGYSFLDEQINDWNENEKDEKAILTKPHSLELLYMSHLNTISELKQDAVKALLSIDWIDISRFELMDLFIRINDNYRNFKNYYSSILDREVPFAILALKEDK